MPTPYCWLGEGALVIVATDGEAKGYGERQTMLARSLKWIRDVEELVIILWIEMKAKWNATWNEGKNKEGEEWDKMKVSRSGNLKCK